MIFMKTSNVISLIETFAPSGYAASWDNCGVQVAGPEKEIKKVAVALDPLPHVVCKALDWGADFILTHHPLAIDQRLPAKLDWFRDVMKQVLCADVTLCAAHTSLDVQFGGVVSWLGRELKLQGLKVLDAVAENDAGEILGYGCIGDLEFEQSLEIFIERVAQAAGCEVIALSGPAPEKVKRVAMCPGSGSSFMNKAFALGADVFITGDVKYHPAQESVGAVLDVGHFSLEEEMMRRFSVVLEQKLEDGIEVRFFTGHNPFAYYMRGKGVCKSSAGLL